LLLPSLKEHSCKALFEEQEENLPLMKPPVDNFSNQAAAYALYRPVYPKALYDFLLEQVTGREAAWDCGTGNGQVAARLSSSFKKVWATDISENQLRQARVLPNVTYLQTRSEQTNLPAHTFDLITVAQAIHWFDFERFYQEVRRTAKPQALLAAWGYGLLHINPAIDPVIEAFYSEQIGQYWDSERRYIDDAYQTIPFPFEEIPSPEFTLEVYWTLAQLEGYFNTWSSVQKYIAMHHKNPVTEVIANLQPHWQNASEKKRIRFPVFMRAGKLMKE
jgi:ubiquinone/menaquinone biosynthesis C-methylase UbiE